MIFEIFEGKKCNLAYPLNYLCCIVCFPIIRIITILFYLALTHLPKFKRGQGQTSVILLTIKFLKKNTISKEFLTNSSGANLAYLALLDNFSWAPFFKIRTPLMQNKGVQKNIYLGHEKMHGNL